MSRTQLLYQLQVLDSELDLANTHLAEIAAALGESEALKKAKETVKSAEQELRRAETTVRDLDLEVNGLANKIAQQEKALYGGRSMSPQRGC